MALLGAAAYGHAQQYVGYQGRCELGNIHVVTEGLASSNTVLGTFPGCTVTVHEAGTTAIATLYKDNLGTPLANPFTANTESSFLFFAGKGAYPLDVTIANAGIPAPYTFGGVTPNAADNVVTDPTGDQIITQLVGSFFEIFGSTILNGPTTLNGTSTFDGSVAVNGPTSLNGAAALAGPVTVGTSATPTTLTVYGNGVVTGGFTSGSLAVSGNGSFGGSLSAASLDVTGGASIAGNVTVGSLVSLNTIVSLGPLRTTWNPALGTQPLALPGPGISGELAGLAFNGDDHAGQVVLYSEGVAGTPDCSLCTGALSVYKNTPTGYVLAFNVDQFGDGIFPGTMTANGGTMNAPLNLSSDAPTGRQAADANYVNQQIAQAGANANDLPLAGGQMTGPIVTSSDTPSGRQATSANYVNNQIAPSAAKANSAVQPGSSPSFNQVTATGLSLGALNNNTGLQVFTAPGCGLTPGTVGTNCVVTVTLPVAEPDTNYHGGCFIENAATGTGNVIFAGQVAGKTPTSFGMSENAGSTQATGGGNFVCFVAHN